MRTEADQNDKAHMFLILRARTMEQCMAYVQRRRKTIAGVRYANTQPIHNPAVLRSSFFYCFVAYFRKQNVKFRYFGLPLRQCSNHVIMNNVMCRLHARNYIQ